MGVPLQDRLKQLGGLELAILVCLVAEEHCIFSSDIDSSELLQELQLSCRGTFALQSAVVNCSAKTTIDDFNEAILIPLEDNPDDVISWQAENNMRSRMGSYDSSISANSQVKFSSISNNAFGRRRIADVILAHQLDDAPEDVQVQALELMRTRRIYTRSSMHVAPKGMIFSAVLSRPRIRLSPNLQDLFCLSHFHGVDDALPYLERAPGQNLSPLVSPLDVDSLRRQMANIRITAEMAQYIHNICIFLRQSRFVSGGVSAAATRHFRKLCRALSPLHQLDYISPSVVALATRKVYPHRLLLATADNERSLLWGSEPDAIRLILDGVTQESVIDEVLATIEAPL